MKTNFEIIKTAIYQKGVGSFEFQSAPLLSRVINSFGLPHYKEMEKMKKEFNLWLDRLDIRQAGRLIDFCNENGIGLPAWMKAKKYVIDYNENDQLDLLRIQ